MPERIQFQITGDGSGLDQALGRNAASAERLEGGLEQLTGGALRFNSALQVITNDGATQYASKQQTLNALGIQTTEQIESQVLALTQLQNQYEETSHEAQQLAMRKQALTRQLGAGRSAMGGMNSTMKGGSRVAQGLGYVFQDTAQFSYGMAAGVRSIANNIGPLIHDMSSLQGGLKGLITSLKGPAGVILAVNAATTAVALFGDELFSSGEKADEAEDKFESYTSAIDRLVKREEELPEIRGRSNEELEQAIQKLERVDKIQTGLLKRHRERLRVMEEENTNTRIIEGNVQEVTVYSQQELETRKQIRQQIENITGTQERYNSLADKLNSILETRRTGSEQALKDMRQLLGWEEERTDENNAQKTLVQQAREEYEKIRGENQRLLDGDLSRLVKAQEQTRQLQRQRDLMIRMEEIDQGIGLEPMEARDIVPKEEIAKRAQEAAGAALENAPDQLVGITDQFMAEADRIQQANREMLTSMDVDWGSYLTGTAEGLQLLEGVTSNAFAGIEDIISATLGASEEGAREWFGVMKGIQAANAAASAFVAINRALAELGPIAGPIAAGSIGLAAFGNVAKILSQSPGNVSTSAGGTGAGRGIGSTDTGRGTSGGGLYTFGTGRPDRTDRGYDGGPSTGFQRQASRPGDRAAVQRLERQQRRQADEMREYIHRQTEAVERAAASIPNRLTHHIQGDDLVIVVERTNSLKADALGDR